MSDNGRKINEACKYAAEKHLNQKRKGKNVPYIVHPLEVMVILYRMGADVELIAAGVLHDTVEDTDATIEDIKTMFGDDVAELVAAHTEDKSLVWEERKELSCKELINAPKRLQMLVLADKLSNIREMAQDIAKDGDELWKRFKRGKDAQKWYYELGVDCLKGMSKYNNTKWAYDEFKTLVTKVFG